MKYVFSLLALVVFSAVHAQSNINPKYSYRQKQFLDSLQKTFPQSAIQINSEPLLAYNTPVATLKNEGWKIGMSGEDTVYQMKTDNMHVLKPNTKSTYIPNASEGKMFMMPPAKKKP